VTGAPEPPEPELHLHIDGASRGNPGEAGFGVHVTRPDGTTVAGLYGYLGRVSNNVAEYQALIHGLRDALARGARRVEVFSDSELVVRQISGAYKVKHPAMLPLHREAASLLGRFERAHVSHVRREQNRQADRLANRAVDERGSNVQARGAAASSERRQPT
jgi:ribonuclease HI